MAEDGIRNSIASLLLSARRLFPYLVFFAGAVLGASAIIRMFLPASTRNPLYAMAPSQSSLHELAWLGVSLLLYWLAFGLLERNERSWKLYQGSGVALTGALGIGIAIITVSDFSNWLTFQHTFSFELGIPWFTTGVALIAWSIALLTNNGGACFLWQLAILPISVYALFWWYQQVAAALQGKEPHLTVVIASAIYFAASMSVLLLLSQFAYQRTRPKQKGRGALRAFPSKYHELFARGRFCELFELPCTDACPLSTSLVAQYQQRRVLYRHSPELLEPFEKAYTILVIPQKRELCKAAHEIMRAKEKQLGARRFHEMEIYLWNTLWDRLQDGEYMGDPQHVIRDKNRLLKEIEPK